MNQRAIGLISAVIVALLIIGGVVYVKLHPSQQLSNASTAPVIGAAVEGKPAPNFVTASTGGEFNLATETKPIFLEIFATWCPHCQHETAVINRLYDNYHGRIDFLSVPGSNTGMDGTSPETELDILAFQNRFGVKYPVGAYDPSLRVAKEYLQGGYPTIAIIGKNKIITYLNSGEVPYNELAAQLNKALK
jgi:cytochrome c biogenesis protein CcmG/thiol:disulfide interchange protein DsbE